MSTETTTLIFTAIIAIAGVAKAIAEARKAKHEKEKARIEALRADEAEKTTSVIIRGVDKAKKTINAAEFTEILDKEIQGVAKNEGVEEKLNLIIKKIRKTENLGRIQRLN
tara:strand:+ start:460 stop:792 length:333 start_codon:yes stop_codon:yes gene_type:complete